MDYITRAIDYRRSFIKLHPEHKAETLDLLELMQSEIEEGGSPDGEYESFVQSVDDLLEEQE